MREYFSDVSITFSGNGLEADSPDDYRERVKHLFKRDHDIDLTDEEIRITHHFPTNRDREWFDGNGRG